VYFNDMKIELKPVASIPEALQMVGDCECGEHAYSVFRRRSTQGRGRPYLVRGECAGCGRWLFSVRKSSILARVVSA
jgi:hypothetical protein